MEIGPRYDEWETTQGDSTVRQHRRNINNTTYQFTQVKSTNSSYIVVIRLELSQTYTHRINS